MPATRTAKTPRQIFDELCNAQGRRYNWVAAQAGMSGAALTHKFRGDPGYRFLPNERERIAAAIGATVALIWGDEGEGQTEAAN